MKYAVITGASRGIGLAAAKKFVSEGYQVIGLSRTPCPLPNVQSVHVDFSHPIPNTFAETLAAELSQPAQSLVVIHNAGISAHDQTQAITPEQFQQILQINLFSVCELNQIIIPLMPHHQGSGIIYIGSTLSFMGAPSSFSYTVSKHGILGMMRASAQDLKPLGIHAACVCPSFTDTDMLKYLFPGDQLQKVAGNFGALISPDAIAKAIFFAATTPECNGLLLPVDKGAYG